jgi:hypothetical protein
VHYRGEQDADFGEVLRRAVERKNRTTVASPAGLEEFYAPISFRVAA